MDIFPAFKSQFGDWTYYVTTMKLEEISKKRNTKINIVNSNNITDNYLNKFPYLEHADNIAVALEVCKNLGIDSQVALDGMLQTPPDPGALIIWDLLFENKNRLVKTLHDLFELLGERPAVVARELTKLHEEIIRGTLTDCIEYFSSNPPKGECIILVGKNDSNVYFK